MIAYAVRADANSVSRAIMDATLSRAACKSRVTGLANTDPVVADAMLVTVVGARRDVRAVRTIEAEEAATDAFVAYSIFLGGAVVGARWRAYHYAAVTTTEARGAQADSR